MAYNIIKGKVEFSNSTTGSIESLVDNWRNQSVGGVKTFTNTVSASAFWDTDAGGEVRALKSLIGSDGANRVLTSDGDGTLTAESNLTIDAIGNTGPISLSAAGQGCHITGSTFSGSAHGITGILLNPDHLASENYDGLANRLSASNLVLGIGLSSSVHVAPASSGHGPELQVTGGQGIVVDTEGVRVLTASNGGLAFTGLTLQVDASKTTNKGGGPSNNDEFIIADSSDSDSIKNLTYSQIKTAIADSISVPITSYTNNGDNRIITSVNSTTVNAEANLSFDGSGLQVSGNISVSGSEHMPGFFIDNSQVASHSNTNIGINTDRPDGTLTVTRLAAQSITYLQRSGSAFASDGLDIAEIRFQHKTPGLGGNASRYSARILAEADGSEHNAESQPGRLSFWTCPTGTVDPVQRMMINNSGNIGIGTSTIPHTLTVAGTVSASLGVSALSFTGDGSGLTGVTGEWDGSHVGNSSITGSLYLTDALSASSGITGSSFVSLAEDGAASDRKVIIINGQVSASHTVTATSFAGDGSGLTGVSAPGILTPINASNAYTTSSLAIGGTTTPDHKIAVSGAISSSLGYKGLNLVLDAGGTGRIGVTGDTDLMTLTEATVAVEGAVNATNLSASSTVNLVGPTNFGKDNETTVSNNGIISSSAEHTLYKATLDRIIVGNATISDGLIDGTTIGNNAQSSGKFTQLSASGQTDLVGTTRFGYDNYTTISLAGVISSSATATLHNATIDQITVGDAEIKNGQFSGSVSGSGLLNSMHKLSLDRLSVGAVIGDLSASLDLSGKGIVVDDGGTIGPAADIDLMTLTSDSVTVAGQTKIDRDYSDTDHAMIDALHIDFDKTGNTTSNNTMYGIFLDMDNTTATNGNNTMYGIHCSPTLTHAADAGSTTVYGALFNAQGGTNGSSLVQAARFEAGGGDVNYGIQLDVEDGGVDLRIESSADSGDYFQIQTTTHGATTFTTVDDDATAADLTFTIDGDINLNPAGGDVNIIGALSASGQVNLPGAVQFGTENQTTVSSVGILSSSATATLANATLDRITLQEINTVPAGNGAIELIGGLNTTSYITSSLGVHVTGSEANIAIGDHKGTGMVGMLSIRPSGDLAEAENNKIHILCQRSEATDNRIVFAVSGSGKVAVGGGHLDGVLNVSGSGIEKLISAKSDLHNPAFYVSGSGDTFIKGATINSGSFTSSGSVRAPLLRETIHTYAPGDTDASYVRFYEPGRNTSFDKKVIMVKPYLGNLDKIIARGTSAAGSTAISFHKAGDGSATPNGTAIETVTVDMSSANTSYTFMFDPGTSKFAAGDVVSVKVNPSTDPGDITLTCVWEYDTRTT